MGIQPELIGRLLLAGALLHCYSKRQQQLSASQLQQSPYENGIQTSRSPETWRIVVAVAVAVAVAVVVVATAWPLASLFWASVATAAALASLKFKPSLPQSSQRNYISASQTSRPSIVISALFILAFSAAILGWALTSANQVWPQTGRLRHSPSDVAEEQRTEPEICRSCDLNAPLEGSFGKLNRSKLIESSATFALNWHSTSTSTSTSTSQNSQSVKFALYLN